MANAVFCVSVTGKKGRLHTVITLSVLLGQRSQSEVGMNGLSICPINQKCISFLSTYGTLSK